MYQDDSSLETISDPDYYCACDFENGYIASDEGATGECIRVALVGGKDCNSGTDCDECWPIDTAGQIDYDDTMDTLQDYAYAGTDGSFLGCVFYETDATDTTTDPDVVKTLSGFSKCDENSGYYMYYTAPDAMTGDLATTVDAPCMYAAYMPGQQFSDDLSIFDECWAEVSDGDILYADDAALQVLRPGCMLNDVDTDPRTGGNAFAVCDEANGWYMPDDGTGNVDTSWLGKCIPYTCSFSSQCNDGNMINGDGCTQTCLLEEGYCTTLD